MTLSMERWRNKIAVVTGASSGIGRAITTRLLDEGLHVIGIARRDHEIREISETLDDKFGKLDAIKCDMSDPDEIVNAFKLIGDKFGAIHLLVNNAGVLGKSSLHDGEVEDWRRVLDTNVLGLSVATREAIRNMRENGVDGDVVHISSICGRFVMDMPNHMYYASKHAVTVMTEVLRRELVKLGSKIRITCISPGLTDTKIFEESELEEFINDCKQRTRILDPADIADSIIYALSTPPHVHIQELMIRSMGEIV